MKKEFKNIFLFSLLLLYYLAFATYCNAQISSPGLGASNSASWTAFGIGQYLDSTNKTQSFTFVGLGRMSGPVSQNPYYRKAIFVLNQEFYRSINKHFRYSLAVSYRNQNEYQDHALYELGTAAHFKEVRLYGRYTYQLKIRRFKLSATYRQDVRSFFEPNFNSYQSPYELRSRFKLKAHVTLDKYNVHSMSASIETLFSTSKTSNKSNTWSTFDYEEARFCFYYSINPKSTPFIFDIGYMNDLIGKRVGIKSVSYLACDVIWENPFKAF